MPVPPKWLMSFWFPFNTNPQSLKNKTSRWVVPAFSHMAVWSRPMGAHFGVGAPPIFVYFSGDWDVRWGYDLDVDPWPYNVLTLLFPDSLLATQMSLVSGSAQRAGDELPDFQQRLHGQLQRHGALAKKWLWVKSLFCSFVGPSAVRQPIVRSAFHNESFGRPMGSRVVRSMVKWLWVKNMYQNDTLATGTKDQNPRNPGCVILSHTQIAAKVPLLAGFPTGIPESLCACFFMLGYPKMVVFQTPRW